MPLIQSWAISPPEHHQDFEVLCRDLVEARFGEGPVNRFGRNGQAQSGVDILVEGRDGVRGFQCKHRRLTLALVEAEIAKTTDLPIPLNRLDFLTSFESDARLEEQVMALSQARRAKDGFPVGVVFWGTMKDWMAEHQEVAHRHYPQAFLTPPPKQPAPPLDRAGADRFRALAARQKRREVTVAEVLGRLRAEGHDVESMADVHERLTRFELSQPKAAPAPAPSFADRIAKRSREERSRQEAVEEEAERSRRESLVVRESYENELVRLLDACERSVTVANDALSSDEITVERDGNTVAMTRGKYTMVVRHHQCLFFSGVPYALAVGSERTGWRQNDVNLLITAKLELGLHGDGFVWKHGGRAMGMQAAAEWAVEWLFRP